MTGALQAVPAGCSDLECMGWDGVGLMDPTARTSGPCNSTPETPASNSRARMQLACEMIPRCTRDTGFGAKGWGSGHHGVWGLEFRVRALSGVVAWSSNRRIR